MDRGLAWVIYYDVTVTLFWNFFNTIFDLIFKNNCEVNKITGKLENSSPWLMIIAILQNDR